MNETAVIAESKRNDSISKYSYLRTTAKKEIIKPHASTAFINGMKSFPKATLQPLFNMVIAL